MHGICRVFSAICAVLIASVGWAGLGCQRGSGAPPGVVLITLDTTRADHLGGYGHKGGITPNLDALAREGVLYTRAWSTSPWTLPAHASMFTGKYPTRHGADLSDHGELRGEHGLAGHGYWLYEELIRAALIVRLPHGRRAGNVVDATVSVVDLLTIVAEEVGFRLPESRDAVAIGERNVAFAEFRRNPTIDEARGRRVDRDVDVAIRWPRKLIASGDGRSALYQIDTDPGESRPVATASIEESMRAGLASVRSTLVAPESMPALPKIPAAVSDRLRDLGYIE